MVIEFLTFDVDPAERDTWLEVEQRTWSRFLEQCHGFVRKQIWMEQGNPGQVHVMVEWVDQQSWSAITPEQVHAVDATMGQWFRPPTMRAYDVIRDD